MRSRRATVQIAAFPSDHKVRCPLAPANFFNRRAGSRIRLYREIDMLRSRSSLELQQPPALPRGNHEAPLMPGPMFSSRQHRTIGHAFRTIGSEHRPRLAMSSCFTSWISDRRLPLLSQIMEIGNETSFWKPNHAMKPSLFSRIVAYLY